MFWITLQVAAGGAIGAALRFLVSSAVLRLSGPGFPLGIVTVNVVGSFLMGVIAIWSFSRGSDVWNPLLMTGVLGGFTTFSTFSLEAFTLYDRGDVGAAAVYVALSVVGSLAALGLGVWLARSFFT